MIGLKVNGEFLDLPADLRIMRERNSPFFLSTNSRGEDVIPGEVTYPFTIPVTDRNARLLGFPHYLPTERQQIIEGVMLDNVAQVSVGTLQFIRSKFSLNPNHQGLLETTLQSNLSNFSRRIGTKLLSSLQLGGARSFTWEGYDLVTEGFWKHVHDTWLYEDCDDGDYVFYPVANPTFREGAGHINAIKWIGDPTFEIEMDPNNAQTLCPHIYLVYLLKQCFSEHGYALTGDILDDEDFKKLTIISFRAVFWSRFGMNEDRTEFTTDPLNSATINLPDHVPPGWTIGKFLVELQKFLPIGFEIDDATRTCVIRTLPASGRKIDLTSKVDPNLSLSNTDGGVGGKVIGFQREFGTDGYHGGSIEPKEESLISATYRLPITLWSADEELVLLENSFYNKEYDYSNAEHITTKVGDNTGNYVPEGVTESISCAIVPTAMFSMPAGTFDGITNAVTIPYIEKEGYYAQRATEPNEALSMHVAFYRGKTAFIDLHGNAPFATNGVQKYMVNPVSGTGTDIIAELNGQWSLAYVLGIFGQAQYGMVEYWWRKWLNVLEQNESVTVNLLLTLQEYLSLKWSDEIIIENTSFIIKKIIERLPYNGVVEVELVRWIK